jgi:hypothetical protein
VTRAVRKLTPRRDAHLPDSVCKPRRDVPSSELIYRPLTATIRESAMKRACLLVVAVALVLGVSALAFQENRSFPLLDWAAKATAEPRRVALLLEFGLKDNDARDWSGEATVTGAKVAHREGYRFRADDKLVGTDSWEASSHRGLRVPPKNPQVSKMERIATVGVVMHLEDVQPAAKLRLKTKKGETAEVAIRDALSGKPVELWNGLAAVRRISVATPVVTAKTEDDYPAAAYGPDGTLWLAYVSYTLRDPSRRIEAPSLKEQPKDFAAFCKAGFADQVWLRSYRDGKWSGPIAITDDKQDIARCALAVGGNCDVWVAYSLHATAGFMIFARKRDAASLSKEIRLGALNPGGSDVAPVLSTSASGEVVVAYQSWDAKGRAGIAWESCTSTDKMTIELEQAHGNSWHPALAASPHGHLTLAADNYATGSYDIDVVPLDKRTLAAGKEVRVAASEKLEARPSIVYDRDGRLWIAYEEGPEKWGKDYGSLDPDRGNPLYSARSVRVVCIDTDGKLKRPVAELPTSTVEPPRSAGDALVTHKFESGSRYAYPKIGLDGKGRVWVTYRRNFGSRYSSHPGAYWLTFARRLDGDHWSEEIELHHSDGLLDSRPAVLPNPGGGLTVIHNTDGRYTTPNDIDNQIYMSVVDLPGEPVPAKLVEHKVEPVKEPPAEVIAERKAVERMHKHRIDAAGKSYRLLRGDFHRHTEMSWDGSPDGSLEDMFRYAIDAAAFDWIANGDHDNGAGREYSWWLTQKYNDAYHVPGAFTPMFSYERSVSYPHGHRNVMFAQRGVLTLPRLAAGTEKAVAGIHPDDTKMLYRYLHEYDGICASHTSATGMGTDWRDNDPVVEPVVEIYQGDRNSYEHEGAPRAGHDPKSGKEPANIAGWYPKGYVNLALGKGYKLGFQASSDHWSTHISFFVVLAEKNDRKAILDAIKARHCYAATDNIVVDFRSGDKIMGDSLTTEKQPSFSLYVHGTADLAKVEILRDSEAWSKLTTTGAEYKGGVSDPKPLPGMHYYYARIVQSDGEIAWSSPIWVEMKQ